MNDLHSSFILDTKPFFEVVISHIAVGNSICTAKIVVVD